MFLQVISVILSLKLILIEGSNFTETCQKNSCINEVLESAVELIKKGIILNKKNGKINGDNCILDIAIDLIEKTKAGTTEIKNKAADCEDYLLLGFSVSGIYTIWPRSRINNNKPLSVYCDMQTDGGGWTVLQRRGDFKSPVDYFDKEWSSYKAGFGDIEKDFWLGNDNIFALTNQKLYSVRFDMKDINGTEIYAVYDSFWIGDETQKYVLHVENYSGTAGDSLSYHNHMNFTTKDSDNDNYESANCAQTYKGGWWFNGCHKSCLNGLYLKGKIKSYAQGVNWHTFTGHYESLVTSEIKIRSKNFRS